MFTGIIKELGSIELIEPMKGGKTLAIGCKMAQQVSVDQSININGACHTVTKQNTESFTIKSVAETLRKTNISELVKGDEVNLERSLQPEQLLDGHLVQGHVDTVGKIKNIQKEGTGHLITINYPEEFNDLVVGRGSITINGISLTIATLQKAEFTVAIIPYTFQHTNMKFRQPGDSVNIEFDILGKYVARYLENRT